MKHIVTLSIAVCLLCGQAIAQKYKLTNIRLFETDSARYDFYTHSYDGKNILFSHGKPETLYAMEKGKPTTRKYVNSAEKIRGWCWSPSGDKILYGIQMGNSRDLYLFNCNDNKNKMLASGSDIFGDFLWDSTRIIRLHLSGKGIVTRYYDDDGKQVSKPKMPFALYRPDSLGKYYMIFDDGAGKRYINEESYGMFLISPDRSRALASKSGIYYLVNLKTGESHELAISGGCAAWSSNKRMIVFIKSVENPKNPEYGPIGADIYIMDSNGNNVTRLTFNQPQLYDNPQFSFDDRMISFYSGKDKKVYIANLAIDNKK